MNTNLADISCYLRRRTESLDILSQALLVPKADSSRLQGPFPLTKERRPHHLLLYRESMSKRRIQGIPLTYLPKMLYLPIEGTRRRQLNGETNVLINRAYRQGVAVWRM